ncbi:MAG: hypothetical protein IIC51_01025 [Planctomycetes bacterium]|nr:hypothetical protein [Planctomycetota bacterium]
MSRSVFSDDDRASITASGSRVAAGAGDSPWNGPVSRQGRGSRDGGDDRDGDPLEAHPVKIGSQQTASSSFFEITVTPNPLAEKTW